MSKLNCHGSKWKDCSGKNEFGNDFIGAWGKQSTVRAVRIAGNNI